MSNCAHCGYGDGESWSHCPSCGQTQATSAGPPATAGPSATAGPPAPYMLSGQPQHGPGAAPARPAQATATSGAVDGSGPGHNPYAAPSAAGPPPAFYPYPQPVGLPTSGKAIASMVLGIMSIIMYFMGFILGPLAIGLWASSRSEIKQIPPTRKGQGMAVAGLVTGIIGTLLGLLVLVVIILALVMASSKQSIKY